MLQKMIFFVNYELINNININIIIMIRELVADSVCLTSPADSATDRRSETAGAFTR